MTDNEIIKALEEIKKGCWANGDFYTVIENAIDLINHKKAEIERLGIELKAMRGAANSYKAEIERLQKELKITRAYIHDNGLEFDLLSYSKRTEGK